MASGVGDTLREAREQRGVEIEEVAASTKIQPRLLRAIEAEDWDALPGDFYASRFITTYAQYLGLDAAALVADYERGAAGGVIDVFGSAAVNHRVAVTGGVLAGETANQLRAFFAERRK